MPVEKERNGKPVVAAKSRAAWGKWLERRHAKDRGAWLILHHQASGRGGPVYAEAVEEALRFGWVDSRPAKRDAESSYLYFSPRNPKSKWSGANKARVERLLAAGRMAPAGMALVELAKRSGTWTALEAAEAGTLPADLARALTKNKKAGAAFEAFPPSSKRGILEWIGNAKKEETRKKRVAETVALAAQGLRANHYRQPKGPT